MPVDDDPSMVAAVVEKRLADPSQIRGGLLGKRDTRSYSRVNEKIFAERCRVGKALEELEMLLRDGAAEQAKRR